MELLAGQEVARRAGVEQRRQGGRSVDDDHWPAGPAAKSATMVAVPTPRSGREPSSTGLSARRDAVGELPHRHRLYRGPVPQRQPLQPPYDFVGHVWQVQGPAGAGGQDMARAAWAQWPDPRRRHGRPHGTGLASDRRGRRAAGLLERLRPGCLEYLI